MEIKKLELSEYSECVEESVKYAITPLYWPIYCFYKTHSQQNCYQILFDSSESLSSVVSSNEIPMFSDYGINFTKSLSVVPRQRVLLRFIHLTRLFLMNVLMLRSEINLPM